MWQSAFSLFLHTAVGFVLCSTNVTAQSELIHTHTAVFFAEETNHALRVELLKKHGFQDTGELSEFGNRPVVFVQKGSVNEEQLVTEPTVVYISPVYSNTKQQFVTYRPDFFVRLNNMNDRDLLSAEAANLGLEIIGSNRFIPSIIKLKTNKTGLDAMVAVKALKATGLFRTVSPNLMHTVNDCSVNDPRFNRQWNLKNQGTSVQGNGTPGADIDVELAWELTTGSPDINIVIVDSGVDTLHPELEGKLLPGFDAMGDSTNGYPTPNYDSDGHGTSCAGIAAANTNNDIGVAGVCQDCRVTPLRVFNYQDILGEVQAWSETQFFLDAMGWQTQADIDVSSNSWAVPDVLLALFPGSDTLVNAVIDEVVDNGRGGLGVPMLFSSGNDGITDTIPLWPARYEKTIAVGATSMCDEHKSQTSCDGESWWAGNWGDGLEVSAPGVRIPTIDMLGSNGFHATEYYNNFNGTSAACPNAAGTMGLILSHTPSLPGWLARKVLNRTCEKVGGYDYSTWKEAGNWSYELGYGRINANNAVTYGASAISESVGESRYVVETHVDRHLIRFSDNSSANWQLVDIHGRLVVSGADTRNIHIQHDNLTAGLYLLKIQNNGLLQTEKLMIQ